jgi:hypothetical protein
MRNVGCFEPSMVRVAIARSSVTFIVMTASMVVMAATRTSLTYLSILVCK